MRRLLFIAACYSAMSGPAQVFVDNGAAITVQAGAQVTVKGDMLNTPGSTISNNGTIDLSGDFTNNSGNELFGSSQGTVLLNGGAQTIGGGSVTLFNNLALLGGAVTLTQDISTGGVPVQNGVLALGTAQLHLNTQKLLVLNPDPGALTRTSGYLVSETEPLAGYGEVQWLIGASAPGTYVFPFGNDVTNDYLPLIVTTTAPGAGGSGSITCSTYPTDPFAAPNNRPLPAGLPSLTDLVGLENAPNVVDRFWPMRADNFSTTPTATITFTYRDSEWSSGTNAIAEGLLQAQRFNGAVWSQPPMGAVNTAANTVTTALTNNFDIVWALVQSSAPLPVELLAFEARPVDDEVACSWTTATELNNDFFTVERSADGTVFIDIGEVEGSGTTLVMHDYAFTDEQPLSGLSYYRLRQTNLDGTDTWSEVVAVWRDAPSTDLVVYPNPASGAFNITGAGPDFVSIRLVDAAGRSVKHWRAAGLLGLADVPAGSYTVIVERSDGQRDMERLVVR
jgi:hypothetical protein